MVGNFLQRGVPAPWFVARSPIHPNFHIDTVAGRYEENLRFLDQATTPSRPRADSPNTP